MFHITIEIITMQCPETKWWFLFLHIITNLRIYSGLCISRTILSGTYVISDIQRKIVCIQVVNLANIKRLMLNTDWFYRKISLNVPQGRCRKTYIFIV